MIEKPGGLWVTGSPIPEYPLTPGAAGRTKEAFYETAEDMEDVVDEVQAKVEERLPWLKDDISSYESSNPRTPTPELLNETFEFRNYIYDVSSFESSNPKTPSPEI